YQPDCVMISCAFFVPAMIHCCARRVASGAVAAGAVTPMPGCVVKMPPTEPMPGSGSVIGSLGAVVLTSFGVIGPCIVCTPLMSTSSIQYCTKSCGGLLSTN